MDSASNPDPITLDSVVASANHTPSTPLSAKLDHQFGKAGFMAGDLSCRVETSYAGLESLREAWDEAAAELGGSVYMTYDWTRTWWDFYGGGKELRLFLFYSGERIVGLLPVYIDTLGFGPLRFRLARLVGANIPPKVFNPPVHEQWAAEIMEGVIRRLFCQDRCDVISFGPISELNKTAEALERLGRYRTDLAGACEVTQGVHSVFNLPANMEEYYSSLSKNERKNRRKYELRLLKKEFATRVEVLSEPNKVVDEFDAFARQHATQWHAESKPGHFGSWPRALEYNRALVRALGPLGRLRFIRIVANDEVIANQYAFAFGDTYYWELPSRVIGKQWERFSLGPTGIVTMIEVALQEGKARLEGGLAHYDYKVRLGAKEHAVKTVRLAAPRPASRFRLRLYSAFRKCLEVGYHKIWYRRIAPRLPSAFWKPQCRLWLRLDF